MTEAAIVAAGLCRAFATPGGAAVQAVADLSFRTRTGDLVALVGPDGAGKTTLLRMVAGLLRPDAGSLSVLGIDVAADPQAESKSEFIKWFADTGIEDVPLVGGKNASLGEMYRELAAQGVKVPNGFSITAEAYRHFLRETGVDLQIQENLADLDTRDRERVRFLVENVAEAIAPSNVPLVNPV